MGRTREIPIACLSTLLALVASSGAACDSYHSPTSRCLDARTLESCSCYEGDCSCYQSVCPNACAELTDDYAICARSGETWPGCDPARARETHCDGTASYECQYGFRSEANGRCSGVCLELAGAADCFASAEPWPACDPQVARERHCDGDTLYECRSGYRVAVPQGCGGDSRCVAHDRDAVCIRRNAVPALECPADLPDGRACVGTTQVWCTFGYVIDAQRCAACGGGGTECAGRLGGDCGSDGDCAQGLVCHVMEWGARCSAPCPPDQRTSQVCIDAATDSAFPHQSIGQCDRGWCI